MKLFFLPKEWSRWPIDVFSFLVENSVGPEEHLERNRVHVRRLCGRVIHCGVTDAVPGSYYYLDHHPGHHSSIPGRYNLLLVRSSCCWYKHHSIVFVIVIFCHPDLFCSNSSLSWSSSSSFLSSLLSSSLSTSISSSYFDYWLSR